MSQTTLRKYSLRTQAAIEPTPFEGILSSLESGSPLLKDGAYLTTNQFDDPEKAHRFLAITYTPRVEHVFTLSREMLRTIELVNPELGPKPTRVWPAFGLHGGGCEIVLIRGRLRPAQTETFSSGGQVDPFRQESVKSSKLFVRDLAATFAKWLKERKLELPEKLGPWVKILDGIGVVIAWIGMPSGLPYSISCAYREEGEHLKLRFWGYVWKDSELERLLPEPTLGKLDFSHDLDELKKRLSRHDWQAESAVQCVLSDLHERLIPIARGFDTVSKDRVALPPYQPC